MLSYGSIGFARINSQIVVVQAARPHDSYDKYLDVYIFVNDDMTMTRFHATESPFARISSKDLLGVVPDSAGLDTTVARYEFDLPPSAVIDFAELCDKHQKRTDTGLKRRLTGKSWMGRLTKLR